MRPGAALKTLLAFAACAAPAARAEPAARPNRVVFLADDLGFSDVGAFGSGVKPWNEPQTAIGGRRP